MAKQRFSSYDEFFVHYVSEHSDPRNRMLHAAGTSLAVLVFLGTFAIGKPWWALFWIPVAYGFAWFGHFVVERNKPATFQYPFWSFISDFRMLGLMATGRLSPWLARAREKD